MRYALARMWEHPILTYQFPEENLDENPQACQKYTEHTDRLNAFRYLFDRLSDMRAFKRMVRIDGKDRWVDTNEIGTGFGHGVGFSLGSLISTYTLNDLANRAIPPFMPGATRALKRIRYLEVLNEKMDGKLLEVIKEEQAQATARSAIANNGNGTVKFKKYILNDGSYSEQDVEDNVGDISLIGFDYRWIAARVKARLPQGQL